VKFILGLVLNSMLFVLSWIIPKKRNTIICGGGMGERFSGNPKYLFLYLDRLSKNKENPFHEYYWITKNQQLLKELRERNLPVLDGLSIYGFWKILRSDFLVIESGPAMRKFGHDIGYQRLFLGRFKTIQTWHGSPAKRILLDALRDRGFNSLISYPYYYLERLELRNLWLILAMGHREKGILQQAFDNKNVHILGYPKNDIFFDRYQFLTINSEWSSYDKVILYAPTFRDKSSSIPALSDLFFKKLNILLKKKNWIFLIKKHPFDNNLNLKEEFSNIKDISTKVDDIQVILIDTDLLITDYSSIYVDFLLTKRDIIFYTYDYNEYEKMSRAFYYDMLKEPPGVVVENENSLLSQIDIFDKNSTHDNYNSCIKTFHLYNDSNSNKRLVNFMINNRDKR